jgi:hypothetical protein
MKKFVWFLPLFLLGCPPPTPKPVPHQPTDTASCATACKKLQDLKCEEGKPLEDGTTCEKFCTDTQTSGHALRPSCILEKVQKCADIQPLCFEK